jgi:protein TonB
VNLSGTVLILFQLSANGELRFADVSQSSGNILLDKIALRSVRRAAPFPLPPKGIPDAALTFKIPINFR